MSSITDEGKALLSQITNGKLVITRACFDVSHTLEIVGSEIENEILKLTLRTDNIGLNERVNYQKVLVFAKIENDETDVCLVSVEKSSYVPSESEMPEFVEDIELWFKFETLDNITVELSNSAYALKTELDLKPNLFVQDDEPDCAGDYIWYKPYYQDDETDDKEVILDLVDEEQVVNIESDGSVYGVENATEEEPSIIIIG